MASLYIIFRPLPIVGTALLVQNADRECLLQKGITNILFVGKDLLNVALMPFQVSRSVGNFVCFQASLNLQEACPFQVLPVNAADDLCLLRVNDQIAVGIFGVAKEPVVVDLHLALLITELDAHSDIGG